MVWSADQDDAAGTALSAVVGNSPQFNKGGMCPMKHYHIDVHRLNNFLIASKTWIQSRQ
jgi:hypothetical protein